MNQPIDFVFTFSWSFNDVLDYVDFFFTMSTSSTNEVTDLATSNFISKAKNVHGDRYDYRQTVYVKSNKHVIVGCYEHGAFTITPNNHLRGKGCRQCGMKKTAESKQLTTSEFISRANLIHGNRYNYREVVYAAAKVPVKIICPEHGGFWQKPTVHLSGAGCGLCGHMSTAKALRLTQEEFVQRSCKIHSHKYSYSKVNYINNSTKVEIICPEHGAFWQLPGPHLSGMSGCRICHGRKIREAQLKSQEEFIVGVTKTHGARYDYSRVVYSGSAKKVVVVCKDHGPFEVTAGNLLAGHGCCKCAAEKNGTNARSNTVEFIEKAKKVHGNRYDYSQTEYTKKDDKVLIGCKVKGHGIFSQAAGSHLNGAGCYLCRESKGERIIRNILLKKKIPYIPQYKIPLQKNRYRYDFYLPDHNLLIEFHGKQHYDAVKWFGGEEGLSIRKQIDATKESIARDLKYKMLTIPYTTLNHDVKKKFEKDLLAQINRLGKLPPFASVPVKDKWRDV